MISTTKTVSNECVGVLILESFYSSLMYSVGAYNDCVGVAMHISVQY